MRMFFELCALATIITGTAAVIDALRHDWARKGKALDSLVEEPMPKEWLSPFDAGARYHEHFHDLELLTEGEE